MNANLPGTAFCLLVGVHQVPAPVNPKTGNSFTGEFGAVVDGTGATFPTREPLLQGLFAAHNQDIDNVTIRNLIIRDSTKAGIAAFYNLSDGWAIENNEIANNKHGVQLPNSTVVAHNFIHHNVGDPSNPVPSERGGAYGSFRAHDVLFLDNEIAFNGPEQKVMGTQDVTFRDNFVHHNMRDGIWYDTDNTGAVIEGNLVTDNGREGIFYEVSAEAVIRNNTVLRNGVSGIFISTSRNVEIYGNVLESNYKGIQYYLSCDRIGGGSVGSDLANNSSYGNTIQVSTQSYSAASALVFNPHTCTSAQVTPYLDGSKNLTFKSNRYLGPSLTTRYWGWGNIWKSWAEWQALGQDITGTLSAY